MIQEIKYGRRKTDMSVKEFLIKLVIVSIPYIIYLISGAM